MESRLVNPVGFSKGWAELELKNPPPLVPSCLIASMKPTGPSAMVWLTPLSEVVDVDRSVQGVDRTLADEDQAGDGGDGKQDIEKAADDDRPRSCRPSVSLSWQSRG